MFTRLGENSSWSSESIQWVKKVPSLSFVELWI
jgi:hypothetical protein